jgi:hypothetical protein
VEAAMRTTILAYAIAFLGLIMIAGGIWGLFDLFRQTVRIPMRYYAMAIGMICGGFAMAGLAQALRLLLIIVTRG